MNKISGGKKLEIVETFTSIQGESSHSGKLCFFIRLAGCNLNCSYCDTEYAKNPSEARNISLEKLALLALKSGASLVEITGGEPLVQKNVPELCHMLLADNLTVLVETNGSLPIKVLPRGTIKIVDCKCPSSGESNKMHFGNFNYMSSDDEIKFVIENKTDYNYAVGVVRKYGLFEKTRNVLFGPVSGKLEASELVSWMIKDKLNVRLNLQIHKLIWPHVIRGV